MFTGFIWARDETPKQCFVDWAQKPPAREVVFIRTLLAEHGFDSLLGDAILPTEQAAGNE